MKRAVWIGALIGLIIGLLCFGRIRFIVSAIIFSIGFALIGALVGFIIIPIRRREVQIGALIGAIFCIIIFLLSFFPQLPGLSELPKFLMYPLFVLIFPFFTMGTIICGGLGIGPCPLFQKILFIVIAIVVYALIGAFVGFIVGKIRKKRGFEIKKAKW